MADSRLEDITPARAAELVDDMIPSRRPSVHRIQENARLMQAGQWNPAEGIVLDEATGRMISGQHVARAIELAGVTVTVWVFRMTGTVMDLREPGALERPDYQAEADPHGGYRGGGQVIGRSLGGVPGWPLPPAPRRRRWPRRRHRPGGSAWPWGNGS